VRFGALPNGMRYAIIRSATPPGQASLRMRIDAGSLMETDAQQGLAHFLEHMAFNGSKGIARGRDGQDARAAGPGLRRRHQRLDRFR
jgi:zinc protease